MAYKIQITGIREPQKVKDLVHYLVERTRLQPKTIAQSLKNMPYELAIIQDHSEMKEVYAQLLERGAALNIIELKNSLLEPPEEETPKKHIPPKKISRIPRAPLTYKKKTNQLSSEDKKKITWGILSAVALIIGASYFISSSPDPAKKKAKIGVAANKAQGMQNGGARSEPKTPKQSISDDFSEAQASIDSLKASQDQLEDQAQALADSAEGLSLQDKIVLLKKSLNLDPYNQDTWLELKKSVQMLKDTDAIEKILALEDKIIGQTQATLEGISRSIGGAQSKIKQSLGEIELQFSKTYQNEDEFHQDAQEAFLKFQKKHPKQAFKIKDPTGKYEIQIPPGGDFQDAF